MLKHINLWLVFQALFCITFAQNETNIESLKEKFHKLSKQLQEPTRTTTNFEQKIPGKNKKAKLITLTESFDLINKEVKKNHPIMVLAYKDNSGPSNVIRNMAKIAVTAINHKYPKSGFQAFFVDIDKTNNNRLKTPGQVIFYNSGEEVKEKAMSPAQVIPYKKLYHEIEKSLELHINKDQEELQKEEEKLSTMNDLEKKQQQNKLQNKRKPKKRSLNTFANDQLITDKSTRCAFNVCRQLNQ